MKKYFTGMAFGTFDLFHRGHYFYLSEAMKQCEKLVIVVARESRVLSGKGILPNDSEVIRIKNIQENFPNAMVVLGDEKNIFQPIVDFSPEVLFFGYDQKFPENILQEKFENISMIRISAFQPEKYKSSILRKNNQKF